MDVVKVSINVRPWQRRLLEAYRDEYQYESLSGAARAALAEWARTSPWARDYLETQAVTSTAPDGAVLTSTEEEL